MGVLAIVYRTLRAISVALLVCVLAPAANAQDVFTVENVEVDATGASATEARDLALAQGQAEAFSMLIRRMVSGAEYEALPPASPDDINVMVTGYRIADEKIAATRYRARLTVTFNPDTVRQYMQGANVAYTEAAPRTPILVLPVLIQNGRPALWEDPNPWRDAWNALGSGDRLVSVVLPLGDLEDIQGGDLQAVLAKDYEKLLTLRSRYRTDDVLVAAATITGRNPDGTVALDVVLDLLGKYENKRSHATYSLPMPESAMSSDPDIAPEFFTTTIQDVVRKLDQQWKNTTAVSAGAEENSLPVLVPVAGLEEWMDIRQKLTAAPQVKTVQVLAISAGQADIVLHYRGELTAALDGLAHNGLSIQQENGYWVLRKAGI